MHTPKIQERAELERELSNLKERHRQLMRGRLVPSSRAQAIQRRILDTQDLIKRLDNDAAERIALEKAPIDDVLAVIAIPLLADVINDIVVDVNAMLRRQGVQETVFGMYTKQISRAALAMIDTLESADANLPRLLDADDTLVDAIRRKLMSFIKQRLNIQK